MLVEQAFKGFNKLKVLIIGDVMIDAYMWGNITRMSPEARVPVVSISKKENRLGGAANVALNIEALGAQAFLCSVIGDDEKGKLFHELMKKSKLSSNGILKSKKRITTVKTRVIAEDKHQVRVDEEIENAISAPETKALTEKIKQVAKREKINVIIFEDYIDL